MIAQTFRFRSSTHMPVGSKVFLGNNDDMFIRTKKPLEISNLLIIRESSFQALQD